MTPEQQAAIKRAQQNAAIERTRSRMDVQPNSDGTYGDPPEGMFLDPRTGAMTDREMLKTQTRDAGTNTSRADAFTTGAGQGLTMATSDEMAGAAGSLEGEGMGTLRREQARAIQEVGKEDHPVSYTAGEIAGSILFPFGRAKSLLGNLFMGGAAGAAYSAGAAEGDDRGREAVTGGLVGMLAAGTLSGLSRGTQRVLKRADAKPSAATYQAAKRALYKEVDNAGIVFDQTELQGLAQQFDQALDDAFFVPGMGGKADQWQQRIARMASSGRPVSLSRLDNVRSQIFKAYRAAPDEVELLDAIKAIDDVIDAKNGGEVLNAARAANKVYRKVELLETALVKAEDMAGASGSGGNIENQFRSAFRRILNNEKKAQFFNEKEIEAMRNFVRGDLPQEILRRVGKLSPSGNGLMQALNLGAIAYDPAMMGVTAAATATKAIGDNRVQRQAQDVIELIGTGQVSSRAPGAPLAVPAGVGANALTDDRFNRTR